MRVASGLDAIEPSSRPAFVVVGVFDGLHRGHAYLLEHLVAEAGAAIRAPGRHHVRPPSRRGPRRERPADPVRSGRAARAARCRRRRHDRHRALRSGAARDAVRRVRGPDRRPHAARRLPDDAGRGLRLPAGRARRDARGAGRKPRVRGRRRPGVRDRRAAPSAARHPGGDRRGATSTGPRGCSAARTPSSARPVPAGRRRGRGACSGSRSPSPCPAAGDTRVQARARRGHGRRHVGGRGRRRRRWRSRCPGSDGPAARGWRSPLAAERGRVGL